MIKGDLSNKTFTHEGRTERNYKDEETLRDKFTGRTNLNLEARKSLQTTSKFAISKAKGKVYPCVVLISFSWL